MPIAEEALLPRRCTSSISSHYKSTVRWDSEVAEEVIESRKRGELLMGEGKCGGAPPPLDLGGLRAISVIGRGAKGVVFHVADDYGRNLALKAISKANIESRDVTGDRYRRVWFERDVLSCLNHPLLPSLYGFVLTDEIVGFVMDRCSGGDLNSLRKRQTERMFSEDVIRFYAAELVLALEHLHGLGIVYRDLKPENILIQDSGHLMLVDFDLSAKLTPKPSPVPAQLNPSVTYEIKRKHHRHRRLLRTLMFSCNHRSIKQNEPKRSASYDLNSSHSPKSSSTSSLMASSSSLTKSNSFVGTAEYVSPEVVMGTGHDFAVDWWGLGVVMYEMLYGRTPFRGQNQKETFQKILMQPPDLVGEKTSLRDLIGKLLEKDPNKRIRVEDIKRHEFFRYVDWISVTGISTPPFIPVEEQDDRETIDVEKFVRGAFENFPVLY